MAPTPTPHTARAHAKLAPSAAHRWINCPGSIRESEGIEERSSVYAAEGTAAHELANWALQENKSASIHLGDFVDIDHPEKRIRHDGVANGRTIFEITDEMAEAVDLYTDHVNSLVTGGAAVAIIDVEQRLDMRHLHPGIFGTGDAVIYDIENEHLHVCDFKYGKGVLVSPEDNPQLFLYGVGAVRRYHKHRLKKITLHIVQPRTQGERIKSWETDLLDLYAFEDKIKVDAARTDDPNAPLAAGEWCQFCPVRATCATRRAKTMADAQAEFDDAGGLVLPAISALSPEQRSIILRQADQIFAYVKAVQEAEHANALAGNPPAGWKLVAKRANRRWKLGEEETLAVLTKHAPGPIKVEDFFTEPKLLSPAAIEKSLGKKAFSAIEGDLVVKQSSGVNLVPEDDSRPAIAVDALAEFSAIEPA